MQKINIPKIVTSKFDLPDMSKIATPRIEPIEIPPIPDLKAVSLSVQDIKSLSDEELLTYLNEEKGDGYFILLSLQQTITSELLKRNLERVSKPHWSILPSFWLLTLSVVITTAALVVSVLALP